MKNLSHLKNVYSKLVICCMFFVVFSAFNSPKTSDFVEPYDVLANFIGSGFMGDHDRIRLLTASRENPHSQPLCVKVTYSPGSQGWGGVYWQNKPDNWGDWPGNDFSKAGFKKVTFWAKGLTGDEVIEFKAGGINNSNKRFKDSFAANVPGTSVLLSTKWKQYSIDLSGKNLSSVIGGFAWIASVNANPNGVTFYLDDVFYE